MTLDDHFRAEISRGQPPLVALHNAAQAYAASLKCKCRTGTACKPTCTCHDGYQSGGCDMCGTYGLPDCSQYADETAAWGEQRDREAAELLNEARRLLREARRLLENAVDRPSWTTQETTWLICVDEFLEGKQ